MQTPTNEHERRMAILRAAMPYTTGNSRQAMEVLLQTDSLLSVARRSQADLEACDTGVNPNPEEMLLHIQEFCTPREYDMVQMILNFIKADRLFRNYREFLNTYPPQGNSDVNAASIPPSGGGSPLSMLLQLIGGLNNPENSGRLFEFLMTQLSPEQKHIFHSMTGGNSSAKRESSAQEPSAQPSEPMAPNPAVYGPVAMEQNA